MDKDLLDAYLRSDYRVQLAAGDVVTIRVGEPLPKALRLLAGDQDWGFITAWNPHSQTRPTAANEAAQQRLLTDLHTEANLVIHPAEGRGRGDGGWCEPSFWIVGIAPSAMERLGKRYGQNGWLFGHGDSPAQLYLSR